MSLFSSIRMAGNTLQADQINLQVIGQNIANANTPGYIREETVLSPAPTQRVGGLLLGLGVEVKAVVQKIDNFLEERLRGSVSEQSSTEAQEKIYTQLEELIGAMTDTDLSTSMTTFFNSISEVLNQPENKSVRNLAVLNGKSLTQEIRSLSERVANVRSDVNDRVLKMGDEINRLIETIRTLNVRIAEAEGGNVSQSDAVGLRDQRLQALENLAKLIDIRVKEQPNGTVTVYTNGDYLVAEGLSRPVTTTVESDRGLGCATIRIAGIDVPLNPSAGELHGLLNARDNVLAGFGDRLDEWTGTVINEFNKIYSGGQGLNGYNELTSQSYVTDANAALNNAGLKFTPTNGSFKVLIHDKASNLTHTTDIFVNLNGVRPEDQTTLNSLTAALNAIPGSPLQATVTSEGKLNIKRTNSISEFAFGDDTSGVLAALGINTFFTGSKAGDIDVNTDLTADPAKFAASRDGIGTDTKNAVDLAKFLDRPLESQNGASISVLYDRIVGETTQGATVTHSAAEGARVFEQTLRGEKLAVSGVSVDEEAIHMIAFQKSFQASARFISTLNELFDILVKL